MKGLKILTALIFSSMMLNGQNLLDSLENILKGYDPSSPGIAVGIIENGEIVFHKAIGMANLEYEIPLSTASIFDIASLAKQFTGFAIAKLELEGKLNVQDPLLKYLPELKNLDPVISIEHLLHHSSGIRDIGELFDIGHFGTVLTAEKAMEIIAMQEDLNFAPGSESDYSNTNYVLLAMIVEKITGESFSSWCDSNIFLPMGMTHSFANEDPNRIIPARAVAYYRKDDGYSFDQLNGMSLVGSSAVFSSSKDMLSWLSELMGNTQFSDVFKLMQTKGKTTGGKEINYAYGLGIDLYKGKEILVHSGATPAGFRTSMMMCPEKKSAIVILSNLGDNDVIQQFQLPIFDMLFKDDDMVEEKQEETSPPQKVSLDVAQLERFVGSFLFNDEMKVKIQRKGNELTVQPEGAPEMPLFTLEGNKLDFQAFKSILEFSNLENGKFQNAIIYTGNNVEGQLERVELGLNKEAILDKYIGLYYSPELDLYWNLKKNEDQGLEFYDSEKGMIRFAALTNNIFRDQSSHGLRLNFDSPDLDGRERFFLTRGSRMRKLCFVKLE